MSIPLDIVFLSNIFLAGIGLLFFAAIIKVILDQIKNKKIDRLNNLFYYDRDETP